MGFLAVVNAYAMRSCLNIAITEMVVEQKRDSLKIDTHACPSLELQITNKTSNPENEFHWDEKTQGYILSAFYWGYVITHLPGGMIAERFGGKQVLGFGILGTALLTLVTPMAARAGAGWVIAVRALEGLGEGTTFPALNALLAQWVPPLERGKMGSLVFAGNQIGTVLSQTLTGILIREGDWPIVFYLFGALGVIWYLAWCFTCYSDPASHPYVSQKEKDYLQETLGCLKRKENLPPIPWKAMVVSMPLWALIIGQVGHDWALFTISTDGPKYMKSVMKFNSMQNGILISLPFLVMWFTALGTGWLCDYLLQRKYLTITAQRKIFTTIASVGPAGGMLAASYAGCDRVAVSVLMTIGFAFMGFFYSSLKVNTLDLSPNYAGTLMAFVNGVGAVSGIITPNLIGYLAPNSTLLEWRTVFWISFAVIMATNIIYVIFASAKVQPWNDLTTLNEKETIGLNRSQIVIPPEDEEKIKENNV
ncbi:sialin-like isoform X2 [Rhodnius prolixus]